MGFGPISMPSESSISTPPVCPSGAHCILSFFSISSHGNAVWGASKLPQKSRAFVHSRYSHARVSRRQVRPCPAIHYRRWALTMHPSTFHMHARLGSLQHLCFKFFHWLLRLTLETLPPYYACPTSVSSPRHGPKTSLNPLITSSFSVAIATLSCRLLFNPSLHFLGIVK